MPRLAVTPLRTSYHTQELQHLLVVCVGVCVVILGACRRTRGLGMRLSTSVALRRPAVPVPVTRSSPSNWTVHCMQQAVLDLTQQQQQQTQAPRRGGERYGGCSPLFCLVRGCSRCLLGRLRPCALSSRLCGVRVCVVHVLAGAFAFVCACLLPMCHLVLVRSCCRGRALELSLCSCAPVRSLFALAFCSSPCPHAPHRHW